MKFARHGLPALLMVAAAFIIALVSFSNPPLMKTLYSRTAYYFITLLAVLWVGAIIRCLRAEAFEIKIFLRVHAKGFLFAGAICLLISISVQPNFRVLSDETNLLSVSRSMTYHKTVDNITEGSYYYGNFNAEKSVLQDVEKHRLLLPYVTHLFHSLSGYRVENVYLLNMLALFVLLCLLYVFMTEYLSAIWAFSCMILVAAQPIVSQCATSGGVDLLCALFMFISFYALMKFLAAPSGARFEFLWVSLAMLSNTRQESVLVFAATLTLLFFSKHVKKEFLKSSLVYAATPLVFLPIFWQKALVKDAFEQAPGEIAFSISNFLKNNIDFFKTLFHFDALLPYATLINIAGLTGLGYFLLLAFLSPPAWKNFIKQKNRGALLLIAAVNVLICWTVITSYYRGIPSHPSDARYFVFFAALSSILAMFFIKTIKIFDQKPSYFFMVCILMFILYHPSTIEGRFTNTQILPRKYNYVVEYLKKNASKNILVIVDRPGQYMVHEYGAMSFPTARRMKGLLLQNLRQHLYEGIYVVQEIDYLTQQPINEEKLDAEFMLEPIYNIQNEARTFIRISKVVVTGMSPQFFTLPYPEALNRRIAQAIKSSESAPQ